MEQGVIASLKIGTIVNQYNNAIKKNLIHHYEADVSKIQFYQKIVNEFPNNNINIKTDNLNIRHLCKDISKYNGLDTDSVPICIKFRSTTEQTIDNKYVSMCFIFINLYD